jgi:hypothetical protein
MGSPLTKLIRKCEYKGILHDFVGTRWWKCAIDDMLWQKTEGNPFDTDYLRESFRAGAKTDWNMLAIEQPVVCIDSNHAPLDIFSINDAVRIQPDDWPSYAGQAWTTVERARETPTLAALVIEQDRPRISGDGTT